MLGEKSSAYNIFRPGAYSDTSFYNLDATWRVNDRFTVFGQGGYTKVALVALEGVPGAEQPGVPAVAAP